jgi:hypothetical protein
MVLPELERHGKGRVSGGPGVQCEPRLRSVNFSPRWNSNLRGPKKEAAKRRPKLGRNLKEETTCPDEATYMQCPLTAGAIDDCTWRSDRPRLSSEQNSVQKKSPFATPGHLAVIQLAAACGRTRNTCVHLNRANTTASSPPVSSPHQVWATAAITFAVPAKVQHCGPPPPCHLITNVPVPFDLGLDISHSK